MINNPFKRHRMETDLHERLQDMTEKLRHIRESFE